jgi:hypothetical protein
MFDLFRNVRDQLPRTRAELEKHRAALSDMVDNDAHEKMFEHLYESLTILDSKSSSLLSFNSVLVAVFAIFVSTQSRPVLWISGGIGLTLTLVSSYLLLSVVWVHWSTTDHLGNGKAHETKLLDVRLQRTILYRWAWNLSRAAVLALLALIIHSAYLSLQPREGAAVTGRTGVGPTIEPPPPAR